MTAVPPTDEGDEHVPADLLALYVDSAHDLPGDALPTPEEAAQAVSAIVELTEEG